MFTWTYNGVIMSKTTAMFCLVPISTTE